MKIALSYPDILGTPQVVSTTAIEDLYVMMEDQTIPIGTIEKQMAKKGSGREAKIAGLDIDVVIIGGEPISVRTILLLALDEDPSKILRRSWIEPRGEEGQPRRGMININTIFPIGQRIKNTEGFFFIEKVVLELRASVEENPKYTIVYNLIQQEGITHRIRMLSEEKMVAFMGHPSIAPTLEAKPEAPAVVKADMGDFVIQIPKGSVAAWRPSQERAIAVDHLRGLKGIDLENAVVEHLQKASITCERLTNTGRGNSGVDVLALNGHRAILIQCKGYKTSSVTSSHIDGLLGARERFKREYQVMAIILMTTGPVGDNVRQEASQLGITLLPGDQLDRLISIVASSLNQK